MLNLVRNNRQNYLETIISSLNDYSYRNKRYQIDFAIAIGLCKDTVDFSEFIENKRKTDKLILLEDNLCCAIFDCAPAKSAAIATSHMLSEFQNKNSDKQIYVGVVNSRDYDNDKIMLNSLFDILEYSVDNDMCGVVTNREQIETSNT
ncbi:MAG: hypothetical protein KAR81_00940 [Sulfurimonas sp.]|nr:hypothetical protein [Sulfurimonas sp.]MCK4973791.1 hypothetical protein [Sulfurimonas sp.]